MSHGSPTRRSAGPDLEPELGAAPVPALRVVPDGVVGPHADPVGDGAVLALLLGQLLLDAEGLVGRHRRGGDEDAAAASASAAAAAAAGAKP